MRLLAISTAAATIGVLVPSLGERTSHSASDGLRSPSAHGRVNGRASGTALPVLLTAMRGTATRSWRSTPPPVVTVTVTLPKAKPPPRRPESSTTRIARISHVVFRSRWRTAACIAHYESTDGRYLYNGPNLGPWQINVRAHPWASSWRLVHDWWYSARVAYRISSGGRSWRAWSTHWRCGV